MEIRGIANLVLKFNLPMLFIYIKIDANERWPPPNEINTMKKSSQNWKHQQPDNCILHETVNRTKRT